MSSQNFQSRFQTGTATVNIMEMNEVDLNTDLRQRSSSASKSMDGVIHPFTSSNKSFLSTLLREINSIILEPKAKRIFILLLLNVMCTCILLIWCHSTGSMALTALTYVTLFDIFSLLTCILSLWVQMQRPVAIFSFGYERLEVLSVFSNTMLAQLGALFILKESVERLLEPQEIHTSRLLFGMCLAFIIHMVVTYSINNKAIQHVVDASSSSWLQEHVADMSESLCHIVPGLSKVLLPRINPLALIGFAATLFVLGVHIAIDMRGYHAADTLAAVCIAAMTWGTMFPMSIYSGKILLQTTPSHIIGQLDKCLREASTLDGVLEFRHEHFWNLSFGVLAGSLHVRIRRDANEQMVLAHVSNRLSNLVNILTVQIFKDDWSRASAYQIIANHSVSPPNIRSPISSPVPKTFHSHGDISIATSYLNNPMYSSSTENGTTNFYGAQVNSLNTPGLRPAGVSNFAATNSIPNRTQYQHDMKQLLGGSSVGYITDNSHSHHSH